MDDDRQAAKALRARKLKLETGSRELVRRLKGLECRGEGLKIEVDALCARQDFGEDAYDEQLALLDRISNLDDDKRACQWQLYALTAEAINTDWTTQDVASWCQRALDMGAYHPRLDWQLLEDLLYVRKVPNAPFREKVERAEARGVEMAHVVSLVHRHVCDVERETGEGCGATSLVSSIRPQPRILKRWLGMEVQPAPNVRGRLPSLRLFISYNQGIALSRALDLSPHQSGI